MREKRFVKDLVKFSKGKSILSEVNLENHETQFEMHKIFQPRLERHAEINVSPTAADSRKESMGE